ncbi:MAG: hypothetical protein MJZ16_13540 [Bacteroidales bacterium]|nr:hypothetical protein [Bacteroidales bacterium]
MKEENTKPQPVVGDIFLQDLKRALSIVESNSDAVKTAMPIMLNRHIEEFGKTNESVQRVYQTIDGVRLRVEDITKSLKQMKTSVDKDFKVVSDVLMDFEKEYDMMRSSILWTNRKTTAMFVFMTCCTVLNALVLISLSAMM